MKATEFEYRHQRLVHLFIVGAACLTYLADREDVVWRFVRDSATPHRWERCWFIAAGVLIAVGAMMCTWAWAKAREAPRRSGGEEKRLALQYFGELCYAIGLGSLLPLAGFVILVAGETLRLLRLTRMAGAAPNWQDGKGPVVPQLAPPAKAAPDGGWGSAFREEAVKWGLLLTMIVFVITLRDRDADVLVAASFVIGWLLNVPKFRRSGTEKHRAGA